jgi:type I restriction enzyme S subunit
MKFYKETEFQETEIGKIPKDWEVVRLGKILNLKNGQRPKTSETGKIPIYGSNGIMGYTNEFLVDNDFTIIIGRVGASGEIHLGQGKIWVSDNAIYSENYEKSAIYPLFAYYLLKSKKLGHFASKTTHPIITQTFLNHFLIQLPPLPEQQMIADILSTVDSAIERVDNVVARLNNLKKALMNELLTGRIRVREENGKLTFYTETEFQETEIGKIPKEWKVVKLGKVVEVWDKYRIPVKENERKPGPFPYCGANGIIDYVDGYTHDGEFVLLAEDGGFFGRFEKSAYIMRGKFWANNHVHVLKVIKETIISEFLMYYLNFTDLTPFITGSTRPKLNLKVMKEIPIALPPLIEQMKIADILLTVDRTIELYYKEKDVLKNLKMGLMDMLLTGRVRVSED